jgi:hypothetical protein
LKLVDVGAGHERTPTADYDHGISAFIRFRLAEGLRQALDHARAQRINRRIIDGDDRDIALLRQLH